MPLFLIDFIESLGFGQDVVAAIVLGAIVMYLLRGKSAASRATSIVSTLWLLAVGIGTAVTVMLLFDWADPNVGKFTADVGAALRFLRDVVADWVSEQITQL